MRFHLEAVDLLNHVTFNYQNQIVYQDFGTFLVIGLQAEAVKLFKVLLEHIRESNSATFQMHLSNIKRMQNAEDAFSILSSLAQAQLACEDFPAARDTLEKCFQIIQSNTTHRDEVAADVLHTMCVVNLKLRDWSRAREVMNYLKVFMKGVRKVRGLSDGTNKALEKEIKRKSRKFVEKDLRMKKKRREERSIQAKRLGVWEISKNNASVSFVMRKARDCGRVVGADRSIIAAESTKELTGKGTRKAAGGNE